MTYLTTYLSILALLVVSGLAMPTSRFYYTRNEDRTASKSHSAPTMSTTGSEMQQPPAKPCNGPGTGTGAGGAPSPSYEVTSSSGAGGNNYQKKQYNAPPQEPWEMTSAAGAGQSWDSNSPTQQWGTGTVTAPAPAPAPAPGAGTAQAPAMVPISGSPPGSEMPQAITPSQGMMPATNPAPVEPTASPSADPIIPPNGSSVVVGDINATAWGNNTASVAAAEDKAASSVNGEDGNTVLAIAQPGIGFGFTGPLGGALGNLQGATATPNM